MSDAAQQDRGFEIGVYTFGELFPDPLTGQQVSAQEKLKQIIAAAKLADEAGLDLFGVGEHHSPAFAVTAPSVVLGAIAQATKRIRLTTATTVLSTVDPVRLFEEFATLDLISNGRAEIMAGRGAFVESFPLFGYDLQNYDELFEEKLDLWLQLNAQERVTWSGRYRAPLQDAAVAARRSLPPGRESSRTRSRTAAARRGQPWLRGKNARGGRRGVLPVLRQLLPPGLRPQGRRGWSDPGAVRAVHPPTERPRGGEPAAGD